MNRNNVMFENLRAEMARRNITIGEMADSICVNRDTLGRKLSGKSPLNLDKAFTVQRIFFPDADVKTLFSELNVPPAGQSGGVSRGQG